MRRRNKTGGKAAKTQRPKTLKRRDAPKVAGRREPSAVDATERIALLTQERDEALQQQTATADVLKVISSSPGNLEPIFGAILENATQICQAGFGTLNLYEGGAFHTAALHNPPPQYAMRLGAVIHPHPESGLAYVARTKSVAHINDIRTRKPYLEGNQAVVDLADLAGARTLLLVPMLKEDELIGTISIYRQEIRPFSDKQIELVKNFAAQAVIAIENTRLLNELRESLEQQTATSEVLKVISSSPGELEPVFQAMLANATRICEAKFGLLFRYEGGAFHTAAIQAVPPAYAKYLQGRANEPGPETGIGRSVKTRATIHVLDAREDLAYTRREPFRVAAVELGGVRTFLAVPMIKENELVGIFSIYRQEVRPFTGKQIELVQNFAAQAVIAIENTRLLNELRQRTDDLSEALEQQTASSEVLEIISSSPGELEPVFKTILQNATRICAASFGNLYLHDEDYINLVASHNVPPAFANTRRGRRQYPAESALSKVIRTKEPAGVTDLAATRPYIDREQWAVEAVELGGVRTAVTVPLLKEKQLVGIIAIYRQEVLPFTDKQVELLKNFAAQAVIAIENTRLLNDLNELNRQLEQRVTDQVSEIERMGRLRRFLPPQVADLIVASGAEKQLESHRREITALFCDLRGFTGFSESSDPEDVMALLREYHAAIGEIINKYGGTLERYAGDGVMVVFNDPIPVENSALQAVLMAIDMRAAIGALIEKWRKLGHDIGFGIGVAHGFATLGTIGFEGRFDYAAIGTVSNVASRLCDEAKPGQILISPRVLMAVEKDITVEPLGDFALKGIRRPLMAYNVLATKAAN